MPHPPFQQNTGSSPQAVVIIELHDLLPVMIGDDGDSCGDTLTIVEKLPLVR